ncbi:ABC transporter substrate-binding protein [Albimonas sp. CAU 1670]|uniref:ABC transporter substrate-binding protein n=1 Tax=Albimonas sp. CAU 1670 TaxID=3032599 RepID=UPI0023DA945F|nr:ABC transporter substrate-binding protein [Albimonas sp. CAU 1670]MDF2231725.1 ABC transporter substrate-binding protein [Albimonas sp. CAU 1670]
MKLDGKALEIHRRHLLAAGLAAGGLAMTAGLRGAHAQEGTELRVAANVNPSTLDPVTGRSGGDHQFLYPLYDTLVRWKPETLEPIPGLAKAWSYPDDLTLVLELREGLTFHDGTPLDAAAVKAHLDRARSAETSNIKVDLSSVVEVEATDATTVTLKLAAADRSLPLILTDRAGMVVSPTAVEANGGSVDRRPVGAGAFKYVEWQDMQVVAYERFEDFWEEGLPKVDRMTMSIIPEVTTGVRSVMAGQNDVVVTVPPVQKVLLDRAPDVTVYAEPSLYLHMIYMDFSKPPFDDVRVRRAMNLAIDRETFVKAAMGGLGEPSTTLYPKAYWAHDEGLEDILAYDPDRARALIKETGVSEVEFTAVAYQDQAAIQRREVLMSMWDKVGIKAKVTTTTVAEGSQKFFFEKSVNSFFAAITARPDPSMVPNIIFGKDSSYNGGRQAIPGMDDAIAASRVGTTQEARKQALSQVQRIALEQAVFVPLLFEVYIVGVSDRFTGWRPNLLGRPRYEHVAPATS